MTDSRDQRIAELEAEVEHLRAQMQSLVSTVSHDLRAPLRHITSYAQLVQEDAGPLLNEEVQGFLSTIVDSARHLGAMLDGLLELSRVGSAALDWQAMDLSQAVDAAVQAVALRYPASAVRWNIELGQRTVRTDAALLDKVLCALIDNALKFSAPRAVPVIDIVAHTNAEEPHTLVLCIRDNGVGCAKSPASRLFQPFQRLHTSREFPGLGMGLALVRRAVERLQGSVELVSAKDLGCEVRISLPLWNPDARGAADCGSSQV